MNVEKGREIFKTILCNLCVDNGYEFAATEAQIDAGGVCCAALYQYGYFQDDPNNLDGSFWMAAAGDEQKALEFFKEHHPYKVLTHILNDIFNEE